MTPTRRLRAYCASCSRWALLEVPSSDVDGAMARCPGCKGRPWILAAAPAAERQDAASS